MTLPRDILTIDVKWLKDLLPFPVSAFQVEKLADGYMSDVYRLHIEPHQRSIIVKVSSTVAATRKLVQQFRSYEKEHFFYARLANVVDVPVPDCYFNFYEDDNWFMLGLEDMGPQVKTQLTDNEVMTAARCLAVLHKTQTTEALPSIHDALTAAAIDLQTADVSAFYTGPVADLLTHYTRRPLDLLPLYTGQTQVLSHMDFRLKNLSFNADRVTVFDWGEFSTAPAGFDLAYFAVTSLSIDQRRRLESNLIDTYTDYANETTRLATLASYQLCLLPAIYMPWLMAQSGDEVAAAQLANRLSAAIDDHYEAIVRQLNAQ